MCFSGTNIFRIRFRLLGTYTNKIYQIRGLPKIFHFKIPGFNGDLNLNVQYHQNMSDT